MKEPPLDEPDYFNPTCRKCDNDLGCFYPDHIPDTITCKECGFENNFEPDFEPDDYEC